MGDSTPPVDYPEVLEAVGVMEVIRKSEEERFIENFNEIAIDPREDLPGTDEKTHKQVTNRASTIEHEISVGGLLDKVFEGVYFRGQSSTNELVRCNFYGIVDRKGFTDKLQEKRADNMDYIAHQYQSAGEVLIEEITERISDLITNNLEVGIFTKNRESWSSGRLSMYHPSFWSFDFSISSLNSFEKFIKEENLFWYGIDDIHVSDVNEELMQYDNKERYIFPGRRHFESSVGSFRFRSVLVNFNLESSNNRCSRYTHRGFTSLSMIFEKLLWSLYGYYKFQNQNIPEHERDDHDSVDYGCLYENLKEIQNSRQETKEDWRQVSRQIDSIKHSFRESNLFGERSGFVARLVDDATEIETYAEEESNDLIERYNDAVELVRSDIELNSTIETIDLQNKIKSQNESAKTLQRIGGILTLVIAVSSAISLLIQAGYL